MSAVEADRLDASTGDDTFDGAGAMRTAVALPDELDNDGDDAEGEETD
jgi:hypothetical protein